MRTHRETGKRERGREEETDRERERSQLQRGFTVAQSTALAALRLQSLPACLPPPSFAPFACSCQRLKTRFSDFHVACSQRQRQRQRSLKFMQNVLLHCGGNSIRPSSRSPPLLLALLLETLSKSNFGFKFKSRPVEGRFFIDLCFVFYKREQELNTIIMDS